MKVRDHIHVVARCKVLPGKAEDARNAITDIVAVCREHEPDLLMYEYYFNESETEVIILETFKGNEEIINHGNNTRSHPNVFNAFFEAIEIKSVDFLGLVSEEIMSGWVNFNPTAYKHHDGFTQ